MEACELCDMQTAMLLIRMQDGPEDEATEEAMQTLLAVAHEAHSEAKFLRPLADSKLGAVGVDGAQPMSAMPDGMDVRDAAATAQQVLPEEGEESVPTPVGRRGHCGEYGCTICTARTLAVGLLVGNGHETVSAARLMRDYPSDEVDDALADLTAGGYLERTVWGDYRLPPWLRAAFGENGCGPVATRMWALLAEPQLPPWPGL